MVRKEENSDEWLDKALVRLRQDAVLMPVPDHLRRLADRLAEALGHAHSAAPDTGADPAERQK
jgi:hypothetical protein